MSILDWANRHPFWANFGLWGFLSWFIKQLGLDLIFGGINAWMGQRWTELFGPPGPAVSALLPYIGPAIGAALIIVLVFYLARAGGAARPDQKGVLMSLPVLGMVIFGVAFIACLVWWLSAKPDEARVAETTPLGELAGEPPSQPATLPEAPAKPFYSQSELELILTALRRLSQTIESEAEPARQNAWELSQHWEGFLGSHGPKATQERLTRIKDGALEGQNEIKKTLAENNYFSEQITPVVKGYANTEFVGLANELIQDLQRLEQNSTEDIRRFSRASYERWHATIQPYEGWINDSRQRIADKTKEIRAQSGKPQAPSVSEAPTAEKRFTNRSVDDLFALFAGRTFLQGSKLFDPYKGMWLRTSGKLIAAIDDGEYGFLISMRVNDHLVDCRFDRTWGDALMRYNEDEIVSVAGRIAQNQDPQKIKLEDCELVEP